MLPHPLRNREAVPIIARVLRRPAWLPVPAFALRLLLGEKHILVLDGQHAPPDRLQAAGFTFRRPKLEAAARSARMNFKRQFEYAHR